MRVKPAIIKSWGTLKSWPWLRILYGEQWARTHRFWTDLYDWGLTYASNPALANFQRALTGAVGNLSESGTSCLKTTLEQSIVSFRSQSTGILLYSKHLNGACQRTPDSFDNNVSKSPVWVIIRTHHSQKCILLIMSSTVKTHSISWTTVVESYDVRHTSGNLIPHQVWGIWFIQLYSQLKTMNCVFSYQLRLTHQALRHCDTHTINCNHVGPLVGPFSIVSPLLWGILFLVWVTVFWSQYHAKSKKIIQQCHHRSKIVENSQNPDGDGLKKK